MLVLIGQCSTDRGDPLKSKQLLRSFLWHCLLRLVSSGSEHFSSLSLNNAIWSVGLKERWLRFKVCQCAYSCMTEFLFWMAVCIWSQGVKEVLTAIAPPLLPLPNNTVMAIFWELLLWRYTPNVQHQVSQRVGGEKGSQIELHHNYRSQQKDERHLEMDSEVMFKQKMNKERRELAGPSCLLWCCHGHSREPKRAAAGFCCNADYMLLLGINKSLPPALWDTVIIIINHKDNHDEKWYALSFTVFVTILTWDLLSSLKDSNRSEALWKILRKKQHKRFSIILPEKTDRKK